MFLPSCLAIVQSFGVLLPEIEQLAVGDTVLDTGGDLSAVPEADDADSGTIVTPAAIAATPVPRNASRLDSLCIEISPFVVGGAAIRPDAIGKPQQPQPDANEQPG
jgi:hypothetical protein